MIWAGRPAADGTPLFVRASFQAEQQSLNDLRTKLIGAALAAALAGAVVGVALAGRMSLRLRRAAATAERVAGGDLDARIGATGGDEVAAMSDAVDRMADALQQRLEREQRFVADVAHDLRTPLTGLTAAASLLDDDQVGGAIKERVSHLSGLVEDLLEIARLDSGSATPDLRWVDVGALAADVASRHQGTRSGTSQPCRALVDPRRLERVLENVIGNAERHGAPADRGGRRRDAGACHRQRARLLAGDARARHRAVLVGRPGPRRRHRAGPGDRGGAGAGAGRTAGACERAGRRGRRHDRAAGAAGMRGLAAISLLAALAAGCGSQSGLHVENGGHTVAVVPAGSSGGGGHGTTPALPRRVTARIPLGGVPAIAWDGTATMWAAVWAGGPHLLGSLIAVDTATGAAAPATVLPASQYALPDRGHGVGGVRGRRAAR